MIAWKAGRSQKPRNKVLRHSHLELLLVCFIFFIILVAARFQFGNQAGDVKEDIVDRKKEFKHNSFESKKAERLPAGTSLTGPAYVVDGDTIVIKKIQIRLFGIDAPEMNHPYGRKAKWALFALCKGQKIRAELAEVDAHGRTVAHCYLPDGRDLSAEMVKIGLAIDWPKFSGGAYLALEVPNARKKMWLADARQKGRMDVWEKFQAQPKRN